MSNDRKRPARRGRRPAGGGAARGGNRKRPAEDLEPLHPTTTPPEILSFEQFALAPEVQGAIAEMGITRPTPIQALAIQPVLEGRDVIAQAETGTGKTLAFGAPMISLVDPARVSVLGLVLCPTRELAEQVAGVLTKLGRARGVSVALIVGGEESGPQVNALKAGAQIVVGTPGRVLDLYRQKFLSFPWTEFAVLDEADEMLEIGFIDDVREILSKTPDERRTLLFSATFPAELLRLARECTKDPVEVATARGVATVDTIEQDFFEVPDEDRPLALIRLIEQSAEDDVLLVFCERRTEVERLMRRLERLPYSIKALHGGYDQASRFRVMTAFRDKEVKALVATDVASRGLDVVHVTRVVNYSVPRDVTAYTHRIGRTGRAGRAGHATTLVSPMARGRWRQILRAANWEIREIEPPGRAPHRGERRRERDLDTAEREPRRPRGERLERDRQEPREREQGFEREARDERPRRRSRREREEGAVREPRPEREERPRREDDTEPAERPRRRARGEREERPGREERTERRERDARPAREEAGRAEERPTRRRRRTRRDEGEAAEPRAREEREERTRSATEPAAASERPRRRRSSEGERERAPARRSARPEPAERVPEDGRRRDEGRRSAGDFGAGL